jgi:hypothetical protein
MQMHGFSCEGLIFNVNFTFNVSGLEARAPAQGRRLRHPRKPWGIAACQDGAGRSDARDTRWGNCWKFTIKDIKNTKAEKDKAC